MGPETGGLHLKQLFGAGQALQGVGAELPDLPTGLGEASFDQLSHRSGDDDLLAVGRGGDPRRPVDIEPHVATGPDPRGTGCALATAIACGLARGDDLHDAVANAIAWLDTARTHTLALDGHQLTPAGTSR